MMSRPSSSSMFRRLGMLAVAAVALSGAPLFAHDMWIEPTTFSPEAGADRRRAAARRAGPPRRSAAARSRAHQSVRRRGCDRPQAGRRPRRRRSGGLPARGRAGPARHRLSQQPERGRADGRQVQSVPEGRRARRGRGAESPPQRDRRQAREMFSRCAKSLVLSGSPSEAQGDRPLGFHARARGRTESVRTARRPGSSGSPDLREPAARRARSSSP